MDRRGYESVGLINLINFIGRHPAPHDKVAIARDNKISVVRMVGKQVFYS